MDIINHNEPINLIGLSKDELKLSLKLIGEEEFRADQLWYWVYNQGAKSFNEMHTINKNSLKKISENFVLTRPHINHDHKSVDGTRKWLLGFSDKNEAETVYIPEENRGSLCISSQVGCTLNCKFCHTGTQKLVRNLTSAEIVSQLLIARDALCEWPSTRKIRLLSNIVMMGMGEPLYNYENVAKALKIIMDSSGIAISRRRITLSTSGVVPMIERCGKELKVNLAISLHAVNDELRSQLVPLNKKYPIHELLDACKKYPSISNSRRILFEYVMLKGINDSISDAKELVRLIKDIPGKVNLIPFNPWPGSNYECSSYEQIEKFANVIRDLGYPTPVRRTRGQDIFAACGQLKSASVKQSKVSLYQEIA